MGRKVRKRQRQWKTSAKRDQMLRDVYTIDPESSSTGDFEATADLTAPELPDDGEEVIVFSGRARAQKLAEGPQTLAVKEPDDHSIKLHLGVAAIDIHNADGPPRSESNACDESGSRNAASSPRQSSGEEVVESWQAALGLRSDVSDDEQHLEHTEEDFADLAELREQASRFAHASLEHMSDFMDSDGELQQDMISKAVPSFDVLDRTRPSIQQRRQRPRKALIDDDELEAELLRTWEHDRSKKRARKLQREAQRHLVKPDPATFSGLTKSPSGSVSFRHLQRCFVEFLSSNAHTLNLPPMDKSSRKIVHEISCMLGVKSTSRGQGDHRHPCLAKTKRTKRMQDIPFERIELRLHRRLGHKVARGPPGPNASKGRSTIKASAVGYASGEVVGAAAPELGVGNRGHSMLEKMGWNSGTSLGTDRNRGLLEPVPHIVRGHRAGLG